MGNAAARVLLRQQLAWPRTGRTGYNVAARSNLTSTASATSPYAIARPISQHCCQRLSLLSAAPQPSPYHPHGTRAFHSSPTTYKKKKEDSPKRSDGGRGKSAGKSAGNSAAESSSNSSSSSDGQRHPQASPDEPLDFADVDSRVERLTEHYMLTFKGMQAAGRFDPDVVGSLRVTVDKKAGTTYPLHELAQVVPRGGRAVSLLAHEAAYIKPIMSAVQASPDFNQQPQPDPDNELELVLRIEPARRDDQVKKIKAVAHEWREHIRAVRQRRDKTHVTWRREGRIGPDFKRMVDKELDKVIKAAITKVDDAEKAAIKAAEAN